MGLDTTHDCWHGSYMAFGRWRNELARVAGYTVGTLSYKDGWKNEVPLVDWGHLATDETLAGKWPETPDDPLIVLIVHSDCDGCIYPEQAQALADRLEELLPLLPREDGGGHIGNWQDKTQHFITGLRKAFADYEAVEFL